MRIKRAGRALAPVAVCVAFAATLATAGTLAYLTDRDSAANVFTVGDVSLRLAETDTGLDGDGDPLTNSYEMGRAKDGGWASIAKDPVVTVAEGSADCWLFVRLVESEGFGDALAYSIDESEGGWTRLEGAQGNEIGGVWYRPVMAGDAVRSFEIIEGSELSVVASEEDIRQMERSGSWPTLAVSAYAVQMAGLDAATAWALVGD